MSDLPPTPTPTAQRRPPSPGARARVLAGITAAAVIAVDRVTKALVERHLGGAHAYQDFTPPESIPVLGEALKLTYVINRGMVFGLFSAHPFPFRDQALALFSIAAIILLVAYFARVAVERTPLLFGLGLVLGGAVGNLLDRVTSHYVVDFIDVSLYFVRWPAFNVADAAIVIGVGLMALDLRRPDAAEAPAGG